MLNWCGYRWIVAVGLFKQTILPLSRCLLADYLKECRKCTLLRFSFSGLWDAMWENSLKMSRYVASPDKEKVPSIELFKQSKHPLYKNVRIQAMRGHGALKGRAKKGLRHHEASLFQLSKCWAFTFLVAMVTAESTGPTKAVELFCVPRELPGLAN